MHPLNILIVSPVFVPVADSEAFCGAKMAMALMECGASTTVLSLKESSRRRFDDSQVWQSLIFHNIQVETRQTKEPLRSVFFAARYRTANYARWVRSVVNVAQALHSKRPFDFVYSRSLPMIAHVVGYWCAQKLGIQWIANLNDPWDIHLFPGNQLKVSRFVSMWSIYWLRKTLREADLVTYPSERLHIFHTALSGVKHTAEIIPHVGFASIAPVQQQGFTLVHAGKMGSNEITGRATDALLKGLERFLKKHPTARSETKLIFIGPEDRETQRLIEELGLKENVISTGIVSYQESLRKIREASVCILLEGTEREGIYLPSKLADYIVARRPVLALSPRVGVVTDMGSAGGILRVEPNDVIGVELALVKLYSDFKSGCLKLNAPPQNIVSQFQPQTVAKKFLTAVSNVIGHC